MPPPYKRGPGKATDQHKIPPPQNIRQVPSYLKKLIVAFFSRLFYIYALVWEAKPSVLFVMVFMSVFNGVMPVISALIGQEILNKLAMGYNGQLPEFAPIIGIFILYFCYMFINNIISRIYHLVIRISGETVSYTIKMKLMKKAKDIDISSYDSPEFYAKMENANREAGHRPIEIMRVSFEIISTVISMVSFVVILFAVSPAAPFIIILISIPSAIVNFVYRNKNVKYMFFRSKDRRQMNYYSSIIVDKDMAKEVRMYNLSDTLCKKYDEVFKHYFKGIKKLIYGEFFWNIAIVLVTTTVNCLLYLMIAEGVFLKVYQIGDYSLYTGALASISASITALITTTASIYEGTLFINNMIAYMKEEKKIRPSIDPPRQVVRHIGHRIEFNNVSFKYPGTERFVIKNMSFTIEAGETIVLVGLNGAGKTTLIKLLTRLYDPSEGTILLDGHDIREYSVEQLYEMFGIVFQDFGMYAFSVSENISFGQIDKELNQENIRYAAQQSNADDFIQKLPKKYDTPLMRYFEDDGIELSIGQWQKMAIARAFYSDSDVLILDEPTASLDPMAEQEIFNQFDRLREDKTTIFVSHRLSSATIADKIVVIEDGHLIEMGNHSQLMNHKGKYYDLFTTQAVRYTVPVDATDVLPEKEKPAGI